MHIFREREICNVWQMAHRDVTIAICVRAYVCMCVCMCEYRGRERHNCNVWQVALTNVTIATICVHVYVCMYVCMHVCVNVQRERPTLATLGKWVVKT